MNRDMYSERRRRCLALMQAAGLDGLLLFSPANLQYLTGDRRLCSFVILSCQGEVGLGVPVTDLEDARQSALYDCVAGFEDEDTMLRAIHYFFGLFELEPGIVGLEYDYLSYATLQLLADPRAHPEHLTYADGSAVLAELRRVKDDTEIACLRAAAQVAIAGASAALAALRPGVTECDLAAEAEHAMLSAGADAFTAAYILSGPRTQVAHGLPSERILAPGDLVLVDVHPMVRGCGVTMCRTACLGEPSEKQRQVYRLYLQAQEAAIAAACPGASLAELEAIMVTILAAGGYGGEGFGEFVGSAGFDLEEASLVNASAWPKRAAPPLAPNVVLTVGNRGLYVDDWGVRVQDTVVVGANGPLVLTDYARCLEAEIA